MRTTALILRCEPERASLEGLVATSNAPGVSAAGTLTLACRFPVLDCYQSLVTMMDDQSPTFRLFHRAILGRKQVTFTYDGHRREVCPYILGWDRKKAERVLVFQFAGGSSKHLPPGGDWKCLALAKIRGAATRDGPWHGDAAHRTTQSCVEDVYIDVNTAVPNQPGRR